MNPQTRAGHPNQVTEFPGRIRTVALCHVDPEKFARTPRALPAGAGTSVVVSLDCPEAIHAAMTGRVEILVVDGKRITPDGLTALSFLMEERPETSVYFYVEEEGGEGSLQAWALAA